MKAFLFLSAVLISLVRLSSAHAQALPLYYGQDFLQHYQQGDLNKSELKRTLYHILSSGHIKQANAPDILVPNCNSGAVGFRGTCQAHRSLGYDGARVKMFGQIYLEEVAGGYGVTDVYCHRTFTNADFGGSPNFGPDIMPRSGNLINTEHTWPQSRFGGIDRGFQKTDLHHLFPTDSQMNSVRSSLRFGNVIIDRETLKCRGNRVGKGGGGGEDVYEVPDFQKGDTARAIFYFSTRYQRPLDLSEETALRQWHQLDPVDAFEYERNNQINELQGTRNPFIDFPTLVDRIEKF